MTNDLTKPVTNKHLYAAMGLALWSAMVSAYATAATGSIWTWFALLGALALAATIALRVSVANQLGAHSRNDDALRPSTAPPATFARRLTHVDRGIAALALTLTPLVVALMVGVTTP